MRCEVQVRLFEGPDGEGLVSSHQHACCTMFKLSSIHIAGLASAAQAADWPRLVGERSWGSLGQLRAAWGSLGQQPEACSLALKAASGEPGRAKDELGSPEAGLSRPTAWPEPGAWSLGPS